MPCDNCEKLISVVVPCYNEQDVLPLFYDEIIKVTDKMKTEHNNLSFEFLYINDGSKDNTLNLLRQYAEKDKRVRYISFSRNFGKESAMIAGLENSEGDYVVVLDADLQHPPEFIPQMYEYVASGEYDCASTRRVSRKGESKLLSFFARSFYKVINKISQTHIVDGAQDFRFMTRDMVNSIIDMSEYNRFSKGIFSWVGFNTKYIEYENVERVAGTTKWSFWKLFKYSLEGIFAFSTVPLSFATICSILMIIASFVLLIIIIVDAIAGITISAVMAILCALFFVGGLQLFCIGILGQYLAKTYLEVKARPKYIVKETEQSKR